jgi:hypothetical protein
MRFSHPSKQNVADTMTTTTSTTTPCTTTTAPTNRPELIALGFCGVDDSIHPHQLAILSYTYPFLEFGILFRPDLEGTPRYASKAWVDKLCSTVQHMKQVSGRTMKLAAHLCSTRVNDLLQGKSDHFLNDLISIGFQRVQINATAVNGVDTTNLSNSVPIVWNTIQQYKTQLEFIFQKNDETKPLWEPIEALLLSQYNAEREDTTTTTATTTTLSNVSMLLDESKGTGLQTSTSSWPPPSVLYRTGYAGGIGPNNVGEILRDIITLINETIAATSTNTASSDASIQHVTHQQCSFWIDMESSLRSIKNGTDVFDLDKCFQVIDTVCTLQLMERPKYLNS